MENEKKNVFTGYVDLKEWCVDNNLNFPSTLRAVRAHDIDISRSFGSIFVNETQLKTLVQVIIAENSARRKKNIEARKVKNNLKKKLNELVTEALNTNNMGELSPEILQNVKPEKLKEAFLPTEAKTEDPSSGK
jgi:predicted house-cleaning noncanonical NTP pyrophosphatase (MazG superfamily)